MNWDRNLDQVEVKTLHDLKESGYTAVDKKQIIHLKDIYEFISRFADPMYSGNVRLRMTTGDIPPGTRKIINAIGADKLYIYFSPNVYPRRFFRFCEKLIRTGRISSFEYLAQGTIIADEVEVETGYYHE